MSSAPWPAPHIHSLSAPRLASFSTSTGWPSAAVIASAARTPTQPGRIVESPQLAGGAVHRPRQAHPDAGDLVAERPCLVEHLADEPGGERDRLRGGQVGVELLVALGQHRVREVRHRDAQVALAEVQPERDAGVAVQRRRGRAAGPWSRRRAASGGSTTRRSACSSAITAETVDGASAVRRASSARDAGPVAASTPNTRARAFTSA